MCYISDEWGNKEEHFTCFEKHQLSSASARNFYVETSDTCDKLGVWHVLPFEHEIASGTKRVDLGSFDEALSCGTPIFLYFHGNTKTRSVPWRVDIYKLLSAAGYNVITFDYRGYGDSSGHMTAESDCVYDSLAVLKFIYDHCGSSPVFFWGHSLGTGIVGSLMRHLLEQRERYSSNIRLPRGIILDAPFTCLAHVMMSRKSMWV
ncbi:hypothetical protein P879_06456 [Paragonimus westermani]|uniref:AB hydrolase-1 domain-containing protein n=1 Tax=Paragonimus westermani TaxID=34504 RepID=A0A8T0CZ14_9TREM|nr:hypothetical protein P879_06456 [Paragonimus westermani]